MPILKRLVYVLKVRIISVTEGIDSARDGWEVLASIISVMAERFIKELSTSVFRGQEGAVLAGFSAGDYCFGYTSVPVPGSEQGRRGRHAKPRKTYVICEETMPWVVRVFNWFVREKRSLRWITTELNRLSAPKDHRSTKPHWHHQYVARLLANQKYIGLWPWGQAKNVRDPSTGQVSQEFRADEDTKKWTRSFPQLQIIDTETWEAAQARLEKNRAEQEHRRKPDGRLRGSKTGNAQNHPRYLLSQTALCDACGVRLVVTGINGKYLICPNAIKGVCTCKTQLRRELAEEMILDVIGRKILTDPFGKKLFIRKPSPLGINSWRANPQNFKGWRMHSQTLSVKSLV